MNFSPVNHPDQSNHSSTKRKEKPRKYCIRNQEEYSYIYFVMHNYVMHDYLARFVMHNLSRKPLL